MTERRPQGWGHRTRWWLVGMAAGLGLAVSPSVALAAPVGTLDASCAPGTSGGFAGFWLGATRAQTFTAGHSGKLLYVGLGNIARSPGGSGVDITVDLLGVDGSGTPTGAPLASTTIAGGTIAADGMYHDLSATFDPATAHFLTAGTQYALALHTADTAQNAWAVGSDACPGTTYAWNGVAFVVSGFTSGEDSGYSAYLGPQNDDFARATQLSGISTDSAGTTAGATRETGEPSHCVLHQPDCLSWIGDHSVWYRWRALGPGPTTIDTCTASIDSILAVYTGGSLGSLNRVEDNNNACPTGFGSKVTFDAQAGTAYRIAVGDAGGARENTFMLAVNGPPNEPPKIDHLHPRSHSRIRDRTPRIRATIEDSATDLAKSNIGLTVDGRSKTRFGYDVATDTLGYQSHRLHKGRHTVAIAATDSDGGHHTVTWSFRVKKRHRHHHH